MRKINSGIEATYNHPGELPLWETSVIDLWDHHNYHEVYAQTEDEAREEMRQQGYRECEGCVLWCVPVCWEDEGNSEKLIAYCFHCAVGQLAADPSFISESPRSAFGEKQKRRSSQYAT